MLGYTYIAYLVFCTRTYGCSEVRHLLFDYHINRARTTTVVFTGQAVVGLGGSGYESFELKVEGESGEWTAWTVAETLYRGADKSLARPRRKPATATGDFDVRISHFLS
jgi:hypothetical protein